MKPSEIFEGENSSLKKTYDEATKPLEEISKEFDEKFTCPDYASYYHISKKDIDITCFIQKAFQACRDSMREEILSKLPDKQDERKRDDIEGSWLDNPRIQRAIGFNSCLDQVKNIIKNV